MENDGEVKKAGKREGGLLLLPSKLTFGRGLWNWLNYF